MENLLIEEVSKNLDNPNLTKIIAVPIAGKDVPFKLYKIEDVMYCDSIKYAYKIRLKCPIKNGKLNGLLDIFEENGHSSVNYSIDMKDNMKHGILIISVHKILSYIYDNDKLVKK